jgi:hypothetical protein
MGTMILVVRWDEQLLLLAKRMFDATRNNASACERELLYYCSKSTV